MFARAARSLVLGIATLTAACTSEPELPSGPPCTAPRFGAGGLGTQCRQLVDAEGRVVFLHGVNARVEGIFDVTFDDGRTALEPIPAFTAADAQRMRAMGFDSLRLPLNWSALEPTEEGGFSKSYLDAIEGVVGLADAAGLRVLLDMHQDAYSKEIGEDGAPLWAIVPAPEMLLEGPLHDLEERRKSAQVLAAFATFFGASADGERLRDRFADAAAAVAERFAGDPRIVGIEAFNEPLSDTKHLYALHDRVIERVRAKDPDRLVFFEPDAVRNFADFAPLAQRPPWPGTVYAPHVYTLAFNGTDSAREAMTRETMEPSYLAALDEAASWDAPLAITEFGYDPRGIRMADYFAYQTAAQEKVLASSFVWLWKEQSQGSWGLFDWEETSSTWIERPAVRKALARVTAEAVAGWPTSMAYDRTNRRFELHFRGDPAVRGANLLHVPDAEDFAPTFAVTCDGEPVVAPREPASGRVEVPCGGPGDHVLVVTGS